MCKYIGKSRFIEELFNTANTAKGFKLKHYCRYAKARQTMWLFTVLAVFAVLKKAFGSKQFRHPNLG
jgi:hypothetical protein